MKPIFLLLIVALFMIGPAPAVAAFQAETAPAGQWDFADDAEDVPSWTDDIKQQGRDLALLTGFCTLAMVGFFRKSERLKWITMGASVIYLGFMQSQLISVVNIFALTQWNLPNF